MAKAGQTKSTTTKDKDFAGTGVEGQKGQDAEQVTGVPPAGDGVPPAGDGVPPAGDGVPPEHAPIDEPKVITGEHVLKQLREKGHQV